MNLNRLFLFSCLLFAACNHTETFKPATQITIENEKFLINGRPTFEGRTWQGYPVEGLLPNSRMVQGVFDDLNPETVSRWNYPDSGEWDPERNNKEFIEAMDLWHDHGLMAFTINFQGGSPEGYSSSQPWENNAFEPDGTLRKDYASRMERIIKKADQLGMIVILGIFYFGQDERLASESAVVKAADQVAEWIAGHGYKNILIEVANECNNKAYSHEIIKPDNVSDLILRLKKRLPDVPVSVSFNGNTIPPDEIVNVSDYIILHGNGVHDPARISEMVEQVRALPSFRPMPIVFNEDDHFDFGKPENNYAAATKAYASWGYFDFRMKNEGFDEGYQSVPVNWGISSDRKRAFFTKTKEIFID